MFQALSRRQQDADAFVGALTGAVPLREFMSPRNMVRLVGVRGLASLMLSQQQRGNLTGNGPDPAQNRHGTNPVQPRQSAAGRRRARTRR